jgi:anti-sigma B factor antagonist
MDLKLEIKKEQGYTHIIVHGEVDLYNANELKDKVHMSTDRAASQNIIIDLKDVDYIDSTGLGIMIGIKRRTTENGGKLILVLYSDRINKLFEITGLNKIFTIARSFEAALPLLGK